MHRIRQSIGRFAVLALAAWLAACADRLEQSTAPTSVTVELVTVEQGLHEAKATYRVLNPTSRTLGYQGSFGAGVPVFRLALQSEGKWIERKPAWVECATGRSFFTLGPGAEVTFEVRAERPDLPVRVGVGTWEPVDGDPPNWVDWSWAWSGAVVVEERLNPSGS